MATLNMPGVYSTIDTSALVKATLEAESRPLQRLHETRETWDKKTSAIEDIESKLRSLQNLASELDQIDTLRRTSAKSSDEGVLSATSGAGAVPGTHDIMVNRLASSERRVHDGVDSADTLVGAGTFSYTYDGATRTLHTNAETTLEDLRDLINEDASNPGVNASILAIGGQDGGFHLVLGGRDSGADYSVTVNDEQTTLDGTNGTVDLRQESFTTTQTAKNSQFRVDGYPPTGWLERSSNTVGDVIPGVTLELEGVGEARLSMARNDQEIMTAMKALPDLYNSLAATVDEYTGYDEETGEGGLLQGDIAVNSMLQQIRNALVSRVPGFDDEHGDLSLAAQLGFEFDREGTLSLDTGVLEEAMSENYDAVLRLVGADRRGVSTNDLVRFDSAMERTQPGSYEVEVDWDATGNITEARIRLEGQAEWRPMSVSGNTVTGRTGKPEQGLAMEVFFPGDAGTETAKVRVQKGFGSILSERLDTILDVRDGSIARQKDSVRGNIERLNTQIELQESRLETRERHLREKYARLEATLAEIDSMQSAFQSLFQMLEQQ